MREMKDSGVEWIGEIPKTWSVIRVKHCFTITNGSDPKSTNGDIQVYGSGAKSFKMCSEYKVGPTVLLGRKGTVNIPQYIEGKYWNVDTAFDVHAKGNYNLKLFYYASMCFNYDKYSTQTALPSMTQSNYLNFSIPFFNYGIQQRITDYLDSKCSQIDSIIEKQKQIIEKLKEYKTSLITEVVTKGLDPNVEMKNSGVEWIGKIPKHWNVLKLKFLFEDGNSGLKIGPYGSALKGKTLDKGPYKIYNQAHLIQNDFSISRHYISEETFNELSNYEVRPGDILFSMMGTIGKCRIMPQNQIPGIMDSHLLKSRLNKKILDNFFVYAYDKDYSNQVIDQLKFLSAGTIMDGLNSKILKNIYIAVPPIEEQNQILDYLDSKCSQIDTSITKKELIVEKLQEYKKSIIYEVVTGKREV